METDKIYNMDCLEGIKQIPDNSIDLVVTDPPLTTQECKLIMRKPGFRISLMTNSHQKYTKNWRKMYARSYLEF